MKLICSYALYPLTLLVAGLAYYMAFQYTHLPLVGTYAGVSIAAIIIFVAEKLSPLHDEWLPNKEDLVNDVFFYAVVVQVIFPIALYFAGIYFLELMGFQEGVILNVWPNQLPIIVQFLILAIIGEFFQYWWHRLCHTFSFLWPIHAPHHFPKKLYSWNTSRFHFFDKFVEFFFTVFIFLTLGLSLEVFSYYYLFYAITGYIQHSNFDVRMGWFDYIIASGETHRFHHDSNLKKSKCNYANNFVLFDLIFNTFKRSPEERNPNVGVRSNNVPKGLVEEIKYPFIGMNDRMFNTFLKISIKHIGKTKVKKIKEATLNPQKIQHDLLFRILKENQKTNFGQKHNFAKVKNIEDYKRLIPIGDYEEHRPYIEQIFKNEVALTQMKPHYFTKTSGTTGIPKYIPINLNTQKSYTNSQQLLTYALYAVEPKFLEGGIFSVVGNAYEETLHGKWPCGTMSGKLYSLAHKSVKAKHIFQHDIGALNDSDKKYFYLAALAVLTPNITFYVSPNPSTFLKIFEILNSKRADLKKLIIEGHDPIIKGHARNFEHALKLLDLSKDLTAKDIWMDLRMVTMWLEGSCSFLIPEVKKMIASSTELVELGYLCSEFYGSVPVDSNPNKQVPTLLDNFFEFIEKDLYESGERDTLELHQLEVNKEYYIVVTTIGGFYRYFINDIIKVTGFINKTPTIVFSRKGKGMTNLIGEKISEKQLVSFFEVLNSGTSAIKFFMCLADQEAQKYKIYVEYNEDVKEILNLSEKIDQYLKEVNIEYAGKVLDKRLAPIEIVIVKSGTSEAYRQHCLQKGQRESQFKFLYLHYLKDVDFPFESFKK